MCLSPPYSYPREHSRNLASYLHRLLEKLMASLSISPASLPSVILITLIRIKILQQFPASLGKDKSQTCGPQLPRNSLKLLKEFNKSQPKVWKNIGDKIYDLGVFQSLKPVDSRCGVGSINQTEQGPPIIVSNNNSHSVISNTRNKVMDTLDLVASEVRQTKDSLMLSTTQAIKRL